MKKSFIKEILLELSGRKIAVGITDEMHQNNSDLCDAAEEVEKIMSGEYLKVHQKFVEILERTLSEETNYYFVEGFKLGLHIGIESME